MRPKNNMDVTPAKQRVPTAFGEASPKCELCIAKGKTSSSFGTRFIWLLGRPAMRVCLGCSREMKKVWEGAL